MEELEKVMAEMDFEYFATSEHAITVEGMSRVLNNDHLLFLDLRTHQEYEHMSLPFAVHIPLNELPNRLDELPKDKFIITFCSSLFRGPIAYAYLLAKGYDEVKCLVATVDELVKLFKPGPLAKMRA